MSDTARFTAIEPFIPQRTPFIMVDTLLEAGTDTIRTSFRIPEDHLFVRDGFLTEPGLIENMAQTAAAGTGARAKEIGIPAPVGFIGALKNWSLQRLPATGSTITTEITFLHQVMNAQIVQAVLFVNDETIASCELKIFIQ